MEIDIQIIWLFVLAIPIISWTFTFEEIFREPREYFIKRSQRDNTLLKRKFFFFLHANIVLATT